MLIRGLGSPLTNSCRREAAESIPKTDWKISTFGTNILEKKLFKGEFIDATLFRYSFESCFFSLETGRK